MHARKKKSGESSRDDAGKKADTAATETQGARNENFGAVASKIAHDFNNILAVFALPLEAMRMSPGGLPAKDLQEILERGTAYAEDLSRRISALARALNGGNDAED